MAVQIDLQNYRSLMSDRVDPDTYTVQIEDIDPNDKTREGKPQMLVTLRILGGDHAGAELVERLPLDPNSKAMFRTVGFLSAMGVPTPRKRIRFDEQKLVGRKLMVDVGDNEYNGRTSSQVQAWMRIAKQREETDLEEDASSDAPEPEESPAEPVAEEAAEKPKAKAKAAAEDTVDDSDIDLDDIDLG